jgi:hypothetical protein
VVINHSPVKNTCNNSFISTRTSEHLHFKWAVFIGAGLGLLSSKNAQREAAVVLYKTHANGAPEILMLAACLFHWWLAREFESHLCGSKKKKKDCDVERMWKGLGSRLGN